MPKNKMNLKNDFKGEAFPTNLGTGGMSKRMNPSKRKGKGLPIFTGEMTGEVKNIPDR